MDVEYHSGAVVSDDSVGMGGKVVLLVFPVDFDCSAEMVPMATRAVGSTALT
jgi:hypothetical protein